MSNWTLYAPPTRYQGNCGSCTAFSGCRWLSTTVNILISKSFNYSEQDLLACSGGTCERGNTMEALFERMKRGVPLLSCLPYQEKTTRCGDIRCTNWHIGARKIESVTRLYTKQQVQDALDEGPIIADLLVPQSLLSYKSGIYTGQLGAFDPIVGGHAVAIEEMKGDNVKIANSWRNWGFSEYEIDSLGWINWNAIGCDIHFWKPKLSLELVEPDEEPEPDKLPSWVIPAVIFAIVLAIIIFANS